MQFISFILFMLKLPLLARRAKRAVGVTGILGLTGRAVTRVAPEGTVFVRNELWRARARLTISEGESVVVTGLDGVTLRVEAIPTPGNKSEKQLKYSKLAIGQLRRKRRRHQPVM